MSSWQRLSIISIAILLAGCQITSQGKLHQNKISADDAFSILEKKHPGYFTLNDLGIEKEYTNECPYELYIPKGYKKGNAYPLLMSFSQSARQWRGAADKYKFIFIKADCSQFAMAALREKFIDEYSIDKRKVYLNGFSAGAFLGMNLIFDFPDGYAGAILASGGALDQEKSIKKNLNFSEHRFYITVGEKDFPENKEDADKLHTYLLGKGAKVKFEILKGKGHEYPMGRNQEMMAFLLKK